MKYSIECKVVGKVLIGKTITINEGARDYIFASDSEGCIKTIKIIAKVDNPDRYTAKLNPGKTKGTWNLHIDGDKNLVEELVQEMQELESILAFDSDGSLVAIRWDDYQEEFIPETDEERSRVNVYGFNFNKKRIVFPWKLSESLLRTIIKEKARFKSLALPQAFYRQGINDFNQGRFINAFCNFYFVLEDIYGKGKNKDRQIREEFLVSAELKEVLEWELKQLEKYGEQKEKIKKFCLEEHLSYDADGLIKLLTKVRGNVHHFSRKSSKHIGTPFNHRDYECMAFLALGLSVQAILREIVNINQEHDK